MDKPPSIRWLRAGVAMLWCGGAMFVVFVITGLAHAPRLVSGIFLVLCPLCALVGFVLAGVAAGKGQREVRQLHDQAISKARAAARARRSRG
jgi:bacteriorhodopsin